MKWFKRSSQLANNNNAALVPAKMLLVSDYLLEKSVLFFSAPVSKEEILSKLVGSLSVPDPEVAFHAVMEREKAGGTIVDTTISIPHARLKDLKTIELAVGICKDAVSPEDPTELFFLFLSPKEDTKSHLLFLSALSSLFQTEGFVEELQNLRTPLEVVQKVSEMEKGI